MVAIVTGKGAGIENGSAAVLGARGQLGSASTGRAGESVYVNAATGNLVLSDMDEMLVGRGPDAAVSRTYNSLGAWDGDNNDAWRTGVYLRVHGLTGTYGASGSTVTRTAWDGSETLYTWNAAWIDATHGAYVATDGAGAYDTLAKTSGVWTWTDGDTHITETYDDANSGRITSRSDTSGNGLTYSYTGTLLTQVTTADGGYTVLAYGGTAGNQLQSITTYAPGPSATYTRVFYEYDSPATTGRLVKVLVNLSPADNSKSTGANYETTYTYDGSSQRIASIGQSDGTLLSIGYTLYGSDYRVSSIVQTVATGISRITRFAYDTAHLVTTITDNTNQVTSLGYDANGNLTKIVTPPVGAAQEPEVQEFSYEGDGDLATARLGPGNTIDYSYDAHGNRVSERDSAGNTITRLFSAKNELLTETHYLTPDPDGAGAGTPSTPLVTRYVYDALSRLRYMVTPEARVTEYRYDGFGQQVAKIDYAGAAYAGTALTDATALGLLDSWVSGTVDRSAAQRTDTWYDFRGNISRTATYALLDAAGEGTQLPLIIGNANNASVAQQSSGLYRVTKTGGTGSWSADAHSTTALTGDFTLQMSPLASGTVAAIGISASPGSAGITPIALGIMFDSNNVAHLWPPGNVTVATAGTSSYAGGDTYWMQRVGSTVSFYKGATLSGAIAAGAIRTVTSITGTYYLDATMQGTAAVVDVGFAPGPFSPPEVSHTDYVYDPSGRLLSRVAPDGGTESYVYDGLGRITASTDAGGATTGTVFNDASGTTVVTLANGLVQTSAYDRAGDLLTYTESSGGVTLATTTYGYDNLGRLRFVTDPAGRSNYVYYDAIGRKAADIDADGSVTEYRYDANNNLASTTAYANKLTSAQLAAVLASAVPVAVATNASVAQQSSGLYRVTKTGGSGTTWSADAHSTTALDGDFILQMSPGQSATVAAAGVSASPSTGGFAAISLGIMFDTNGVAYLLQSSSYTMLGTSAHVSYAAGDTFWMQRVGTTVNYYKGATLSTAMSAGVVRSITGVSGSLYLDTTILNSSASIDLGFTPGPIAYDTVRPAADTTNDRWNFNVYDHAQRLIETIDGAGSVTQFAYDGASQLVSTTQRANKADGATLAAMKAAAINPNQWANPGTASAWTLLNLTQTAAGTIDGSNAFTLTVQTTGISSVAFPTDMVSHPGDAVTLSFWVQAGTASTLSFGTAGDTSNWGEAVDTSSAVILSGPGTVTQVTGAIWSLSGLSTTQPTHVSVTRIFSQAESVRAYIYPVTHTASTASGQSIIVAQPSVVINPATAINVPAADTANDRVSRVLYDQDGNVVGTLDAEGYLTETIYDAAGRKIRTVAYSDDVDPSVRASGSLATLKANLTASSANDIRNQWLYDARGLLRASIDGEGTLTRYDYTAAGYLSQQISGQKLDPATTWTLATLPAAGSAILETTAWTYNLYGEKLTETVTLTGSTATTTSYAYDTMRRLVSTTTQSGTGAAGSFNQRYDIQGRLIGELSASGGVALTALGATPTSAQINTVYSQYGWSYDYAPDGLLKSKTGPAGTGGGTGPRTLYYYNADGALAYQVDPLGNVVAYVYDAFGERSDTIVYAAAINAAALTGGNDASSLLTLLTGIASFTAHTDYNVDGTIKQVVDPLGYTTSYTYNAFGEKAGETDPLDDNGPSGAARTIQSSFAYDHRGLLKTEIVDTTGTGHLSLTTSYGYDAFGRVHTLTNALTKSTTSDYDRKGRLVATTDALGNVTVYAYDARDNLVTVTDANLHVTRHVYDKANRRVATIDALGGLTTTSYDADGRVVATRAYKNAISLSGLATEVAENNTTLAAAIANTNTADHVTRFVYDTDGRLRFTVDALMHVVEHGYDALGNEIRTIAYDGTISTSTFTEANIASLVVSLASASGTRITRNVYNADSQLIYAIDATGAVTWSKYDSRGNLIKQTAFAILYATSGDPSLAAMDSWAGSHTSGDDRTTRAWYDAKGQLAFSVDAGGFVTRIDYDKQGNVSRQTAYMTASSLADSTALSALVSTYTQPTASSYADARQTEFKYDTAGRLTDTVEYLDFATTPTTITTHLVLDAIGQITSSTEANGTSDASTTAYTYDDVGRVTSVTRGSGSSAASTSFAWYDPVGQKIAAVDGRAYLSTWTYDAAGQPTAELHYANATTGTITASTAVATLLANTTADTSRDASASYTLDAFGNVLKTVDPRGNASFAYYDALGRVFRQVDAEKFVTDTSYTSFGEVLTVKRWANPVAGTVTEATVPLDPTADSLHDATTSFAYDAAGRLSKATEAEGDNRTASGSFAFYTKQYTYDAFGDQLTISNEDDDRKVNGSTADTTVTYSYDKLGQVLSETLPVSTSTAGGSSIAVSTHYTYDARGNRLTMVEAYGAAEARTTSYTYDLLDRVTRTDHDSVAVVNDDGTSSTSQPVYERTYYDRRGNIIETIDAAGAQVYCWYDALDRAVARIDALKYLTVSTYDKSDNLTAQTAYAHKITGTFSTTTAASALTGSGMFDTGATDPDRTTGYAHDFAGRLTSTTVAGIKTGGWNGATYDFATSDIIATNTYDPAGNLIKATDGRGNSTYTYYDRLGRKVAQVDAENYLTTWTLDAEGNALTETRYATRIDPTAHTVAVTSTVATLQGWAGTSADDRITTFEYDRNGHRLKETRANVAYVSVGGSGAVTAGTASSIVTYSYNGLGQVLTKTEANGDTTAYTYDAAGRLALEADQAFTDYTGATVTPRTAYAYDGLGNLKSTRVQAAATASDTNDRVTTYVYGAGGRLDRTLSAEGNAALAAIGSPTTTQADAIWAQYGHFYGYDVAGRTVQDSYTRARSDGSTVTEAQVTRYDLAGRAITQTIARYNGSAWVFTDSAGAAYDATRTAYNAFGDIAGRGVTAGPATGAAYQERFDYDAGGRLWRSNTGDGVLRFHVYDKAGNETLTLASVGADLSALTLANYTASIASTGGTSTPDAISTVTVYDKRGQLTATREPDRLLAGGGPVTIIRAKTYNAFGEVATETGPGGFHTDGTKNIDTDSYSNSYFDVFTAIYSYNTMGRLVSTAKAMADVTATDGTVTHDYRATEAYGYDLSGRLDRVTDANGNVIRRALLAGTGQGGGEALVTKEFHADGGVFETRYDVFGDARILRNELYSGSNATDTDQVQTYDKMGRLITVQHRGALLTDHYAYDIFGQRTVHWNSFFTSSVKETTDYDAQGRVVSTVAFGGDSIAYRYAWDTSLTTTGLADYDGWVKTTVNVSAYNGAEVKMTESTDYFGRTIGKSDFAAVATALTFDKGGRLVTQAISGGSTTTTTWYNTGLQATITTGTAVSTYSYDISGNRIFEGYVVGSTTYESSHASWDALGRMIAFNDDGVSNEGALDTSYKYDAVGNVRRIQSHYYLLDTQGDPLTSYGQVPGDEWFSYDSMNRFVIVRGTLSSGAIVRGGGYEIGYDVAGRRVYVMGNLTNTTTITQWDNQDRPHQVTFDYVTNQVEHYTYSADGYLAEVDQAHGGYDAENDTPTYVTVSSAASTIATYTYDVMGRVTLVSEGTYSRAATYDNASRVTSDDTTTVRTDGTWRAVNTYSYNATSNGLGQWVGAASGGYFMGGVATRTSTKNYKNSNDGDAPDTLSTSYLVWSEDGPRTVHTQFDGDTGSSSNALLDSYSYFDGQGFLSSAYIDDGRARTVTFVNDAAGRVVQRDENDTNTTNGDPRDLHYYFNGIEVAGISNNNPENTSFAGTIKMQTSIPGSGPFRGGTLAGSADVDFDQSYDAINAFSTDPTAQRYTVQGGDTLAGVALQLWGDASLWYLIADANGLTANATLVAGQALSIPNKVHNFHNNADTFRPYDPNHAQGDLSPTAPKKPKGNKCGVFGQILQTVVTVAITAILSATPIGPIAGSMLGNAAGQLFGMATGIQQGGFSFKSVALTGITTALTLGMSQLSQLGTMANMTKAGLTAAKFGGTVSTLAKIGAVVNSLGKVAGAMLVNAATQGIAIATHLQKGFDFAGVATAGIGQAVSQKINIPGFGGRLVSSMAGGLANAAARSVINGTDFGDNLIAALPDIIGQTIGNMAAGGGASLSKGGTKSIKDGLERVKTEAALHEAKVQAGIDLTVYDDETSPEEAAEIVVTAQRGNARLRSYISTLPVMQRELVRKGLTQGTPAPELIVPRQSGDVPGFRDIQGGRSDPSKTLAGAINENAFFTANTQDDLAGWLVGPGRYVDPKDPQSIAGMIERIDWETDGNEGMLAGNIAALHATGDPTLVAVAKGLEGVAAERWHDYGAAASAEADRVVEELVRVNPVIDDILTARDAIQGKASRLDIGVAVASHIPFAGVVGALGKRIVKTESRIARAARIGREGESLAGITAKKVGILFNGRRRFPDEMTDQLVKEVKNVKYQGWTKQLQDYSDIAKQIPGRPFELWIRESTVISGAVEAARVRGDVIIRRF